MLDNTLGSEFHFREKIPLAVIRESSYPDEKLVDFLRHHPWFRLAGVWDFKEDLASMRGSLIIISNDENQPREIEGSLVQAGHTLITNNQALRLEPDIPLMVPAVNSSQIDLLKTQKRAKGKLAALPGPAAAAASIALKPLSDSFGLEKVQVRSPEPNIEKEIRKILGNLPQDLPFTSDAGPAPIRLTINLTRKASPQELVNVWNGYKGQEQSYLLPSSPEHTIRYAETEGWDGLTGIGISDLSVSESGEFSFNVCFPDHLRDAILVAEFMVRMGYVFW